MGALEDILVTFGRIARDLGIEYTIVGAIAIMYHGIPRATMDIDCLVKADEKQLINLASRMKEAGFFVDVEDLMAMNRGEGHATIEDRETMHRLDIFSAKDQFSFITLEESQEITIKDVVLRIASPETTIISKLRFGSPQDLKDAEGIYGRLHESIDIEKLRRFAQLIGVEKDLESVRRKLSNEAFLSGAPAEVVKKEKGKQAEFEKIRQQLEESLRRLETTH